jgi:putative PIN family toxin of toxin-antitoxin system
VIRAVLDANTIVSGLARFRDGTSPPVEILRAWVDERFQLLISDALLAEVIRTLSKPWFLARVEPDVHAAAMSALRDDAQHVAISSVVRGVASHPEDDLVPAAAVSGEAAYLVTGDRQLQSLDQFQDVAIVSPRDFLTLLESDWRRE